MSGSLLAHSLEGEKGEPVLLLNGGMMTQVSWAPLMKGILETHRVLRCDLRGQLGSPGEGYSRLEDNVDDLIDLLDALEIEAVHLLGTSFGGEIGVLLAAFHGERVRSLAAVTAVDRAPEGMLEGTRELRDLVDEALEGGDGGKFFDALALQVYSKIFRENHAAALAARRDRTAALPRTWFQGMRGILTSVEAFDLSAHLSQISCPTLVVHAAADSLMPLERVKALADGIAAARLRIHPSSGHALVAEDPLWLLGIYREFLAEQKGTEGESLGC